MNRFAKIVATLGPSSSDESTLRELIEAGMDVARLNFSHGTHEDHADKVKLLRNSRKSLANLSLFLWTCKVQNCASANLTRISLL